MDSNVSLPEPPARVSKPTKVVWVPRRPAVTSSRPGSVHVAPPLGPDAAADPGAAAAERLARRYPAPRVSRRSKVVLVGLSTLVALTWLLWAAFLNATPAVSGQVESFAIVSDTKITLTMTVQRRDPSRPATCRLLAQSTDFQPVAEQNVPVPASAYAVVNVPYALTTLRRATTVSVKTCTTA